MSGCRFSREGSDDGASKGVLPVFRDGVCIGIAVVGPGTTGNAFRRFEADIDMGGLAVDSKSSGSSIGCRILPVDGPPSDFDSIVCPPFFKFALLSHDRVRRRGALYSPPDTSVRDDKKE